MTKDEVLKTLIQFFKDVNAVDPNLSDSEIAMIKLPELNLFKHKLPSDRDFKKEAVFKKIVEALKDAHPNHIPPEISPQDESVFEKEISIDTLAIQISEDTPDATF